eukprot:1209028-Prymnesium_polylepis.3
MQRHVGRLGIACSDNRRHLLQREERLEERVEERRPDLRLDLARVAPEERVEGLLLISVQRVEADGSHRERKQLRQVGKAASETHVIRKRTRRWSSGRRAHGTRCVSGVRDRAPGRLEAASRGRPRT